MAEFENLLESFRDGYLSREELFLGVDRVLGSGLESPESMLELLLSDSVKSAFSADIRAALRIRIKTKPASVDGVPPLASDDADPDAATRLVPSILPGDKAADEDADPEPSRTQLAASLFGKSRDPVVEQSFTRIASGAPDLDTRVKKESAGDESEPVKGTGDVLNDRFVLEECLGSGGMSTVYKALDRRRLEANDRHPHVAVKVLNVEFRAHPDSLIALQREAKKSQSLAHPNIVRVYDFDRDGSTVYMTMEYLVGTSLADKFKAPHFRGVPHDQAMRILKGMARALSFAHENGIVHADFKPANVLLTDNGEIKVIDFGIARAFHRPEDTDVEATRFDPGSLGALTPAYASPEMLEQCEPDPRDDIYALACISYEMLTGHHPFARMQATEARDAELEIEREEGVSRRQCRALKAALAFDRSRRTATAERFMNDINPQRIIQPALAATLSLFAVFAGATGYYLVGSDPDPVVLTQQVEEVAEQASLETEQIVQPGDVPVQVQTDPPEDTFTKVSNSMTPGEETGNGAEKLALLSVSETERAVTVETPLTAAVAMPVVAKFPCSALNVSVDNGNIDVRGFASRELDVKRMERELASLPGAGRVASRIQLVSSDKCQVIEMLAPYWVANRSMNQGTSIKARGGAGQLTEGEPLIVDITTPSYASYINVDYFSLDGSVFHMSPGPRSNISELPADQRATLGGDGQWVVSEPYGMEMVAILVTPQPLFEFPRREYESGSDYLSDAQQRLRTMADKFDKNRITADFVFVETRKKTLN